MQTGVDAFANHHIDPRVPQPAERIIVVTSSRKPAQQRTAKNRTMLAALFPTA
jgi:hypothetical protein